MLVIYRLFLLICIVGCSPMAHGALLPTWARSSDADMTSQATKSLNSMDSLYSADTVERELGYKEESTNEYTVQKGDTLDRFLYLSDVNSNEIALFFSAMRKVYNPKRIFVGQEVSVVTRFNNDKNRTELISFSLSTPSGKTLNVARDSTGKVRAKYLQQQLHKRIVRVSTDIDNNLYHAIAEFNVAPAVISALVHIFDHQINFARDINKGSHVEMMFERYFDDNENYVRDGDILYASIRTQNKSHSSYMFVDDKGVRGYYDANGVDAVSNRTFRMPLKKARITSRFGMRTHPISGVRRMHKGVDLAAPTGTPVHAASHGVVSFVGNNNSYGKYVKIKHAGGYVTLYAHLSAFAKGLAVGKRVSSGDRIAYVGQTGSATGPHLHYEVIANNNHIDPIKSKLLLPEKHLCELERDRFNSTIQNYNLLLAQATMLGDGSVSY